jgi:hypothetical protein
MLPGSLEKERVTGSQQLWFRATAGWREVSNSFLLVFRPMI